MPFTSKRKAYLQSISHLWESDKRQRFDKDTKIKYALFAQQIQDKDFWDEYKSFESESSSDESSSNQFNTDESENEEKSCLERLDTEEKIPGKPEIKEKSPQMMNLKWQPGVGDYL